VEEEEGEEQEEEKLEVKVYMCWHPPLSE